MSAERVRVTEPDFTPEQEGHVREALRYLRVRCRGLEAASMALHVDERTLSRTLAGHRVSAVLAVRLAKLLRVGVDDVLTGRIVPPGICPHCGHDVRTVLPPRRVRTGRPGRPRTDAPVETAP